jgi:hypothetical protein
MFYKRKANWWKYIDILLGKLLCANVWAVVAEDEEERVQYFWQVIDELRVGHFVHGLDPAQVEGAREGVLAVHLVLQYRNERVQVELVAFGHNVLEMKSKTVFVGLFI